MDNINETTSLFKELFFQIVEFLLNFLKIILLILS